MKEVLQYSRGPTNYRERSEPSGRETLTFRLGQCEICGNTPLYTLRSSFLWMERLLVQPFPSTKENTRAPVQRVSGRHLSSSHPSFYQHLTSPWTSNRGPELKLTMTTDDEPVLHIAFRRRSSSHFGSTTQYVSAHVPGPSSWLNPRVFSAPLHRPDDAEDSMARSFPDPTSEKKI